MENFKEAIIQIARSNPNLFPNDASTSLIEQRFSQFFSDSKTPNHPPYAAMIYRAISELNEKGGSTEESISTYIKKEYEQLPWAHSTMLKHHLQQLCERNEIHVTHKQCYSLGGADSESQEKNGGSCMNSKKQKRKLKCKRKGNTLVKEHAINDESTSDISCYGNLEQIESKKDPELLQPEESPDTHNDTAQAQPVAQTGDRIQGRPKRGTRVPARLLE